MGSINRALTKQFLEWEIQGRGWQLWDTPVSPEPVFRAFKRHYLPPSTIPDDGRRPTFLSSLSRRVFAAEEPAVAVEDDEEAQPEPLAREDSVELCVHLPRKLDSGKEAYSYLFASISGCGWPVAFELVGDGSKIDIQFALHPHDLAQVKGLLESLFPEATFQSRKGTLRAKWGLVEEGVSVVVECGLRREFMLPLGSPKIDPFVALCTALDSLREGEVGVFQAIFEPVRHEWAESILAAASDGSGGDFFVDAPEILQGAKEKIKGPVYAAVLRLAARTRDEERNFAVVREMTTALRVIDDPRGNGLIPLRNDGYDAEAHEEDLLLRQSRRSGMILSGEELAGLVHLPSADVQSRKLRREVGKTKAVPSIATGSPAGGIVIGVNDHAGEEKQVVLSPDRRMSHMHVIGASGTGKSNLLFNCIRQDILRGAGVAVLDPHGDLIDRLMAVIPSNRVNDVVVLDPGDSEFPVGFNILACNRGTEASLLSSDLVAVFERLSRAWGDQMGSVLRNAVNVFLDTGSGTLFELRRFLLDPAFREATLRSVRDPELLYYWQKGFPALAGSKSVGPIVTRLDTFLSPRPIRAMVCEAENKLDFADIMGSGKILLAKLSHGAIGRENSYLLGTLLVSKIYQTAVGRQSQAESARRDFFMYVDEFHDFITPSLAEILTGARKYRLGLVLSHQELRQMERDKDVASAVLANCYTRVVFRVGDQDARALESGFSSFEAKDIQNLGRGEAVCRVERSDFDFNLKVPKAEFPDFPAEEEARARRSEVLTESRVRYATAREVIEGRRNVSRPSSAPEPTIPVPEVVDAPARPVTATKPEIPAPIRPKPIETVAAVAEVRTPSTPGRGGSEHKFIQQLIKKWAEGMGWRTMVESRVPGSLGSADVTLSKGALSIACEISVTTSAEHEAANLKKCLGGTYSFVVSIARDKKQAVEIECRVREEVSAEDALRIRFFTPDELFAFASELDAKQASKETTVRGYKVKVSYKALDPTESERRKQEMAQIIAKTLKRPKARATNPHNPEV